MAKTKVSRVKPQLTKKKGSFWSSLWFYLKSLFSNATVYEIGRTKHWAWSIILFFASAIITVVPTMVSQFKIKGSNFLSGAYGDNYYYGLYDFASNEANKDLIKFNDDYSLSSETKTSEKYDNYVTKADASQNVYKPVYTFSRDGKFTDLDIYVFNDVTFEQDDVWAKTLANITESNTNYAQASDEKKVNLEKENSKYTRTASFIVFRPSKIYLRSYTTDLKSQVLNGDYLNIAKDFGNLSATDKNLFSLLRNSIDFNDEKKGTTEKMNAVNNNFIKYLDRVYENSGIRAAWSTIGIIFAINAGVMLLAGVIMWAFTRNKTNPNRDLNVLQVYSMSFWLAPTPAILGLVLGFIMPTFAYMSFILMYTMRAMFMITKFLRPPVQR